MIKKMASEFYNPLQETDQMGNVKGVSRTHEGKSLTMTIAWSGKSKRSHTMWVFKIQPAFIQKCVIPVCVIMNS